MADKDAATSQLDISQLRTPIQISGKPVEQIINSVHYGSPELRCLLMDECDLIFECKVCRALFRDLPNFISHKRVYCTKSSLDNRYVTIASLPEEKVVVIQPQAPEETEKVVPSSTKLRGQQPRTARPKLEETILRIQSGELGRSQGYQVYTEAAEKLQKQKEGMKVATIRTTAIPTNRNAVFIDVNMASVNIHERQQQVNSSIVSSYDQNRNDTSVTVIKRKTGERTGNARNMRKSVRQERHSTEPQKLLMEQLKEIQHKVKQKVAAAQDKAGQQKKVRHTPQNIEKDTSSPLTNEKSHTTVADSNLLRSQKRTPESTDLKASGNVQTVLAKEEETTIYVKDDSDVEEVKYDLVRYRVGGTKAAKENTSHTISAVVASKRQKLSKRTPICSKCNSVFSTRKSLGFHMKIHHSAKRTFYPCPYCSSVFYYFFGITRHLSRNHSKSLEEIDAMRKQLREMSFTKPLCTSSLSDEIYNCSSNSRSARTLGRSLMSNVSEDAGITSVTPLLNDQRKRVSGESEVTAAESLTVLGQKNVQLNVSHRESQNSSKPLRPAVSEKIESVDNNKSLDAKRETEESRSVRLKNRQQQRASDGKPNTADNLFDASTPNQTQPSSVYGQQGNTSHMCPKCHRSFRRKISCKNHLKVCKAKGGRTLKTVRSQNTVHKGRVTASDSKTVKDNQPTKVKSRDRTSNNYSAVKSVTAGDNPATSPKKIAVKNDVNIESKIHGRLSDANKSRNIQNRTTSLSRRSSSVDRDVTQDEFRSRSHVRDSEVRDKRDSSVESTQSNVEGKSPRSRRNVLSRYATPAPLSKSPAKFDMSLKTNFDDGDDNVIESQDFPKMDADEKRKEICDDFACSDKEEILHNVSKDRNESADGSEKQILKLSPTQESTKTDVKITSQGKESVVLPSSKNDATFVAGEMNKTITLSPKSLPSIQNSNISHKKPQGSPIKSDLSPHRPPPQNAPAVSPPKQPGSTGKPALIKSTPQGSSSKPESSSPQIEGSKNEMVLISQGKSVASTTTKSKHLAAEDKKPEADSETDQKEIKVDTVDLKHQDVSDSCEASTGHLVVVVPKKQEQPQKPIGLLHVESGTKTESPNLDLTKECDENLDVKKTEIIKEDSTIPELKNASKSSKNNDSKPHTLIKKMVVSALSERPKRKRKVPSRNSDAEEMLSKIHSHNRETVPKKKRKITLEAKETITLEAKETITHEEKETDSPKQESKEDRIMEGLFSSTDNDVEDSEKRVNKTTNDRKETDASEIELSQEDYSSEVEDVDENDAEDLGKTKGRFVSNRMYVLEKCGSKRKRLKCYDQVKVYKLIDEENLKCLECGESCSQVSNLRRHVIRQHLKWSRYKCKLCKFESYDRSECTTHLIRGHRNRTINLRNVNHYIIDLVKQGSHARSLKKNQTIRVKQQSESQEGNIYARPTVKKRLPQTTDCETTPDKEQNSRNKEGPLLVPRSSEGMPSATNRLFSRHSSTIITVSKKSASNVSSSSNMGTILKQYLTSSKAALDSSVGGKASRKSLPFNISTRNSPRTFDTRPYNPENVGTAAEIGYVNFTAKHESSLQKDKEGLGIAASREMMPKKIISQDGGNQEALPQDVARAGHELPFAASEISSRDSSQKSRNIFDNVRAQSATFLSSETVNLDDSSKTVASSSREVNVVASSATSDISAPRIIEVKFEGPRQLLDPSETSKHQSQSPKPAAVNVENSKAKVVSYIITSPQQKMPHVSDETINSDKVAKSLIKLKELGDQLTSSASTPSSQQILKTALTPAGVSSAHVISAPNLQRKQILIPVSSASLVKTTLQKSTVTPKEAQALSPGISLAAALTKSGHISTTAASSFLLSHGQTQKFIIYTRPAGAKELTTVGSLGKPLSESSPLPSSSTTPPAGVKPSEANLKPGSEAHAATPDDVFPQGTFVIRKHYL